ncbi:MAG: glycosyltransferase [Pseudomonadota bacterium]
MRICFIALELLGPFQGGGIASSTAGQAEHHARDHDVTILYVNPDFRRDDAPAWEDFYARRNIRFVHADLRSFYPLDINMQNRAFAVKEFLAAWEQFDLFIFHDYRGLGYYTALARRLGLAFQNTRILSTIHGPSEWARPLNHVRDDEDHLVLYELERRQIEYSDTVVAPSDHILDWARGQGWRLPADSLALSNLSPYRSNPHTGLEWGDRIAVDELCFFGRLEIRKGFFPFLDAVTYLHKNGLAKPRKVTFIGAFCINGYRNAAASVLDAAQGWECEVEFLNAMGRDRAIATLVERRPLTVIPSADESFGLTAYECLSFGVPCLMADRGALKTLAAEPERHEVLVEPEAHHLARRIARALEEGAVIAGVDPAHLGAEAEWDALLSRLDAPVERPDPRAATVTLAPDTPPAPSPESPLVSAILVHHNRSDLVGEALESLRAQTWERLEIIIVDDGSRPADRARLEAMVAAADDDRVQLILQENSFLGAARNAGARAAKGDHLLFMDDDNVAHPHEVARFVEVAQATGADILNALARTFRTVDGARRFYEIYLPPGPSLPLALTSNPFGDANAFIRRTTFEALGGFTEAYGIGAEDYEFFTRAFLSGARMQLIPEFLFDYRAEAQSMTRALRPTRYILDQMRGARALIEGNRATETAELRSILRYAFYKATAPEWEYWFAEAAKSTAHPDLETELAREQAAPNGPRAVEIVARILAAEGKLSAALALLEHNRIAAEDSMLARLQDLDARHASRTAARGTHPNAVVNPAFAFWTLGPRVEGVRAHQYVADEWLMPASHDRPGVVVTQEHDLTLLPLSESGTDTHIRIETIRPDPEGFLFLSQRLLEPGALVSRELTLSFLVRSTETRELPLFLQLTEEFGSDRFRNIHPPEPVTSGPTWARVSAAFDLRDIRPDGLTATAFLSILIPVPTDGPTLEIADVTLLPLGEGVRAAPYVPAAEAARAARRCFIAGREAEASGQGRTLSLELQDIQAARVPEGARFHSVAPLYLLGADGQVVRRDTHSVALEARTPARTRLALTLDEPFDGPGVLLRDAIAVTSYLED